MCIHIILLALLPILTGEACHVVRPSEPCSSKNVKFYMYRSSDKDTGVYIEADDLQSISWDSRQKNHMIINGFGGLPTYYQLLGLKDAFFSRFKDGNVFFVEYTKVSYYPCYIEAVSNARYVGKCVAEFLEKFGDANNGTLDMHILGISLGAHVPANAAQFMIKYRIPRITGSVKILPEKEVVILGLDPAGPLFNVQNAGLAVTLSPASADFVDCIHAGGALLGTIRPMGNVEFFVNNGILQKGCFPSSPLLPLLIRITLDVFCSHLTPTLLFAEDLHYPGRFWARKCDGEFDFDNGECATPLDIWDLMGEDVDQTISGNYSIMTNPDPPYALGKPESAK